MRLPLIALATVVLASLLSDYCVYRSLLSTFKKHKWPRITHVVLGVALYAIIIACAASAKSAQDNRALVLMMWGLFTYFIFYAPKYIYTVFWLLSRVPALFRRKPWKPVAAAGLALAAASFATLLWSSLVTPRQVDVKEVELRYTNLPPEFDGYRIVQFSDLHTGTYGNSTAIVERIVETVNAQRADLAVFTGDIVNRRTDEILPFIPALKTVAAKDGVISILGNHDYGDYYNWDSDEEKRANLESLLSIERDSLGWTLLCNDHTFLTRGGDSIAVIGVENWGEPPFTTYGDLAVSYPDPNDSRFKLLLSHNPKHWDMVVSKTSNINLTLAGHTHAMQVMLTVGGRSYSPASLKYAHWHGLADAGGERMLYVNIGTGEVAVPMRVGATPEITVFTLRRKQDAANTATH